MSGKSPLFKLNNGIVIPALGLGVYLSPGDQTAGAVESAIASGYRLIDTAAAYGSEQQVGEGIKGSGITRGELFVTTKLWIADYGFEETLRAFDVSLGKLGLDYLDLYMLHWPSPSTWDATLASYRAAEKLLAEGRVRAIGVCNFSEKHLGDLIAATDTVPAVNQIELHPLFTQTQMREANAARGILTQAWSPIGGTFINHPREPGKVTRVLELQVLKDIAGRLGKTPAQVALRWHFQNGVATIPKSTHPDRIAANIEIFDFELTADDMAAVDRLDMGKRNAPEPDVFDMAFIKARQEAQAKK
jgi:diketogulonate reductase-like aldo/keto reductase